MNKLHNLGVVVRFEIVRNLKKISFWAFALGFPILMIAIFGVVFLADQATENAASNLVDQKFSIVITDESKIINQTLIDSFGAKQVDSHEQGVNSVKNGEVDAYFYYPADLTKQKVEIYAQDVGLFNNGRYEAVANTLLHQSVADRVEPVYQSVLQNNIKTDVATFRDGAEYDGLKEMVLPGLFLILFYFMIAFFGNQMLNSTVEEKENRTIEMLLTSVQATTLIVGKIISTALLAIIQGAIIILPLVMLYLLKGDQLGLIDMDLSNLPVDLSRILLAVGIFITGFMMFSGFLVIAGSVMPTAKEASQWLTVIIMLVFAPLYGAPMFISYPDVTIVKFLSLFPLTSPVPLLLRNAVGNISVEETILGILFLLITGIIVVILGVRAFRIGAMQYDSRLSLSALRSKRRGGDI